MGGILLVTTLVRMTARQLFDAIKQFSQVQEEWEVDSRETSDYIRELYREGDCSLKVTLLNTLPQVLLVKSTDVEC